MGVALLAHGRPVDQEMPAALPRDPLGDVAAPDVRQPPRARGRQVEERKGGSEPARVLAVEGGPAAGAQGDPSVPREPDRAAVGETPDGVHVGVVVRERLPDRAGNPLPRQALERDRRPLQLPPGEAPRPDIDIGRREVAVHVHPAVPLAGPLHDLELDGVPERRVGEVVVVGLDDRVGAVAHRHEVPDVLAGIVIDGQRSGEPRRRLCLAAEIVVPASGQREVGRRLPVPDDDQLHAARGAAPGQLHHGRRRRLDGGDHDRAARCGRTRGVLRGHSASWESLTGCTNSCELG